MATKLDAQTLKAVDSILDEALGFPPSEWPLFVARARAEHGEAVATAVSDLLDSARENDCHSLPALPWVAADSQPVLADGQTIGGFRILRTLGVGGSASVYLARRDYGQFGFEVALKIFDEPYDSWRRRAREPALLTALSHPGIAQFIDAGSAGPCRSFLAMEYVNGMPIVEYARSNSTPILERVQWIAELGLALEHAHSRLIAHLDIKSSNVFVTSDARVKLLDFGISRGLTGRFAVQDTFALSPKSAAPEQFDTALLLSRATDVFQLGALLYRVLCENHWCGDSSPSLHTEFSDCHSALKARPPSLRMSAALRAQARRRSLADLDHVIIRCLEVEPEDRYSSVADVVNDLQDWINGFPIRSTSPGAYRKLTRSVGRNPLRAGLLLSLAAAFASLLTILTVRYFSEQNARIQAGIRASTAESFVAEVLHGASPYMQADPASAGAAMTAVADSFLQSASLDTQTREQVEQALALVRLSIPLRLNTGTPRRSNGDNQGGDSLVRTAQASEAFSQGDYAKAATLAQEAAASAPSRDLALRANAILADSLARQGKISESLHAAGKAFQSLEPSDVTLTSASLSALAHVISAYEKNADRQRLEQIVRLLSVGNQPSRPAEAARLRLLGRALSAIGSFDRAADLLGQSADVDSSIVGPSHRLVWETRALQCEALVASSRSEEAMPICSDSLELARLVGASEATVRQVRLGLASAHFNQGQFQEAATLARLTLAPDLPGYDRFLRLRALRLIGITELHSGRHRDALDYLTAASGIQREAFPDNVPLAIAVGLPLVDSLLRSGQPSVALEEFSRLRNLGPRFLNKRDAILFQITQARVMWLTEHKGTTQHLLDISKSLDSEDFHPLQRAWVHLFLATAHIEMGRCSEAALEARAARALLKPANLGLHQWGTRVLTACNQSI